jgi:hypothetical protein
MKFNDESHRNPTMLHAKLSFSLIPLLGRDQGRIPHEADLVVPAMEAEILQTQRPQTFLCERTECKFPSCSSSDASKPSENSFPTRFRNYIPRKLKYAPQPLFHDDDIFSSGVGKGSSGGFAQSK